MVGHDEDRLDQVGQRSVLKDPAGPNEATYPWELRTTVTPDYVLSVAHGQGVAVQVREATLCSTFAGMPSECQRS